MPTRRCCCDCVPPTCELIGDSDCDVGSYVELTWTTTGADTVELTDDSDNVLSTSLNGTLLIPNGACVTYTLTATNECGTSTCSFYCCDCDGCVLNPLPNIPCDECAATDDPVAFDVPRGFKLSVSGVGAGTAGNCQFMIWGSCEVNAAGTNTAFFNGDILLDRCDDVLYRDCALKCSFSNNFRFIPYGYVMEYNLIRAQSVVEGPFDLINGYKTAVVLHMESWLGTVIHAVPRTESFVCNQLDTTLFLLPNETILGSATASHVTLSHRIRKLRFERFTGIKTQWKYAIATCPPSAIDPETDAYCNERVPIASCYPAGWVLTEVVDTLLESKQADNITICTKANDVGAASVTCESV